MPAPGQRARGDTEGDGEFPSEVGSPENKPLIDTHRDGASLLHLCCWGRPMALSCVTSTHPNHSAQVPGRCPQEIGSPTQVGNNTSSFRNTELSSCQKSPGDPASKCGRHQGKMQRDLFLLLLPVRFLPPITGLQQTGGESGLVGREATMELGREQLLSER